MTLDLHSLEATGTTPLFNEVQGNWMVLHVQPNQEKVVSDTLLARGAHAYLPTLMTVRFYGKRRVERQLPLFSGYVFLKGQREEAFAADRMGRLVQILPVPDAEQIAWELANLKLALSRGATLEVCQHLTIGKRVRVRSGPMKDLEGIIEANTKNPNRLVLQVDMLGRAMSVEVDSSLLDILA